MKKKRHENGPKFTTIIYFSLFLTNFSVTWKVNYKTEEFTAESFFLPGQYSWVATIHTHTMLGYWSVGMYIRVGGLFTNIDPPGTTKIPPSYHNLSTIVLITVTSTGYYV